MPYPADNDTDARDKHPQWHNAVVDVKGHFDAAGDGATDDTVAIQAAVDACALTGGTLVFPPGTYLVSSPGIVLPAIPSPLVPMRMNIRGYGATIKATTAISMMKRATPASISDATSGTAWRFQIVGLKFLGNGTADQVGLDMIGTYGLVVKDCEFDACDTGCRITFGLMTKIRSCFDNACESYGFVVRSGDGVITGATVLNSGSNHTVLQSCRSSASSGELAQFYIRASSGVRLEDCITEGLTPVNAIDFSASASGVVKHFEVRNHHSENAPTGAVIKAQADGGGSVVVDGLWHQALNCTLIEAASCNASTFHIRDIPWWPTGSKLKHGTLTTSDPTWIFDHGVGQYDGGDIILTDSAYWVDTVVPAYLNTNNRGALFSDVAHVMKPSNGVLSILGRAVASGGVDTRIVATASLPAASATMNGHILIEDAGAGDRNLIIYAGGERFRIDGGANV
jgi:hypothetical protein